MPPLLILACLVPPAEIAQLVLAERRIGVRQLRAGIDPRDSRHYPPDWIGWAWLGLAGVVHVYPVLLLFDDKARFLGLLMLLFSVVGFDMRRRLGMRWALVIFAFEGALRNGVVILMFVLYFMFGMIFPGR